MSKDSNFLSRLKERFLFGEAAASAWSMLWPWIKWVGRWVVTATLPFAIAAWTWLYDWDGSKEPIAVCLGIVALCAVMVSWKF